MILRDKDKQQLRSIIADTIHTPVEVWAYGSRVNGDAHDTSDLDLVFRTPDLSRLNGTQWYDFTEALTESSIPILVQVLDWARIPESFHRNILQRYEVLKWLGDMSEWKEYKLEDIVHINPTERFSKWKR